MKYVQPYGISDPDAPYINGDPSIARMGSIPPAAAFEHPMRELVSVIDNSKLVPNEGDLEQVAKGVRSQRMNYCVDTGSFNHLSVALDPPLTEYTLGLPLHVLIKNTNTGAVDINAGAGTVPVVKPSGLPMGAGDLPANAVAGLIYDGNVFQVINFGGAGGGSVTVNQINIPYGNDVGPVNDVRVTLAAVTSYTQGLICMVKVLNTNTTFATLNINSMGTKPIYAQGGHPNWPLLPGDLQANDVLIFVYDGSVFWIYPNNAITQSIVFNVSTVTQIQQLFAALGRKRITTSGYVNIKLAAGNYGPPAGPSTAVITTYHADADRMMLEGTMQSGMSPPVTGHFARTNYLPAQRAADGNANINMLLTRYATYIRMYTTGAGIGIYHTGPGQIVYKNLLVIGGNLSVPGSAGFYTVGSNAQIVNCCVWGSNDAGFVTNAGSYSIIDCHACACQTRGFTAAGGGSMYMQGGGSYGNATAGFEAAHGGAVQSHATDLVSISLGVTSTCNGQYGTYSDSGTINMVLATINNNASIDMYSLNSGISKHYHSSVGTMSPAAGTIGNLNSISVNYG